jgi:hypothetical protein
MCASCKEKVNLREKKEDRGVDNIKNNKNIYIHLVNLKQNDDEMNGKVEELGWGEFVSDVNGFFCEIIKVYCC